jgi:predicted ribosomally synthesized peptide with nif11-like leader
MEIDRKALAGLCINYHLPVLAMSEEQLTALLARLKEDTGLKEKLQGAGDLDAAVVMAKEAGFNVSKADWLRYQAQQTLDLSDEELEKAAGGGNTMDPPCGCWNFSNKVGTRKDTGCS